MKLTRRTIGLLLLAVAVVALLCFGVIGVGRNKAIFDSIYLYFAGQTWLSGGNPYDRQELLQTAAKAGGSLEYANRMLPDFFAYAPPVAVFALPLSLFSEPAARIVVRVVNLIAVAVIVGLSLYDIYRRWGADALKTNGPLVAALAIGNPFTAHTVWLGQTSLVSFTATYAAWLLSRQQKTIWAGICLGIACFKPHTCVLVFFWFLLQRSWKTLAVCLGTATLMSLYPLTKHGPLQLIAEWLKAIKGYQGVYYNIVSLENDNLIGIGSLLFPLGINISAAVAGFLGLILVILLWVYRHRFQEDDILGVLMGIELVFLFGHTYDYVYIIPVFTYLFLYSQFAHAQRQLWPLVASISLTVLFFIPQQLLRAIAWKIGFPALSHWRTLVVIGMIVLLMHLSVRAKQGGSGVSLDTGGEGDGWADDG